MNANNSAATAGVEQTILPRSRDLGGGFLVRRALPSAERRTVGPFVFFDQMGPAAFDAGHGIDVRPHPHIGLATVTYLFEGELLHRDSLGTSQLIRPAEVNWMIAGRGIVHSERTPTQTRAASSTLSGIQAWIGLPQREEETSPLFAHHSAAELPQLEQPGVRMRLIAGTFAGCRSPVDTRSPLFYVDAEMQPGATLKLEAEHQERAIFVSAGSIEIERQSFDSGRMLVLSSSRSVLAQARSPARLLLLGGAPLDGPRYVWWNFVSSSPERMQRAADDWRDGRFGTVPGDSEFIPLPDTRPPVSDAARVVKPTDYP